MVDGRPAAFASAAMPEGVMSGVPTICCSFSDELTVLLPLKERTSAPTPKATRMIPAAIPPYSKIFCFMVALRVVLVAGWLAQPSCSRRGLAVFVPTLNFAAAFPQTKSGPPQGGRFVVLWGGSGAGPAARGPRGCAVLDGILARGARLIPHLSGGSVARFTKLRGSRRSAGTGPSSRVHRLVVWQNQP